MGLVTPSHRYPLQRGWHYVERRNFYGMPQEMVVYAPTLADRLILRWQRAWRSWRRPR